MHSLTGHFARLAKQFWRAPLQAIFTPGGDVLLGGYGFWLLTWVGNMILKRHVLDRVLIFFIKKEATALVGLIISLCSGNQPIFLPWINSSHLFLEQTQESGRNQAYCPCSLNLCPKQGSKSDFPHTIKHSCVFWFLFVLIPNSELSVFSPSPAVASKNKLWTNFFSWECFLHDYQPFEHICLSLH